MNSLQFVRELQQLKFENVFNPYSEHCGIHDLDGAPQRRSNTLQLILDVATKKEIDSIWIGRDLGYRGGRRTGLALTDDIHIHVHAKRWNMVVQPLTKGEQIAERTAAAIWNILSQIEVSIFLWNVFPLHPHEPNDPFSNRPHNAYERKIGEKVLNELVLLLKPRRLLAIGNDAARSAHRSIGWHEIVQVRHPSYGGYTQFMAQMRELYDLSE